MEYTLGHLPEVRAAQEAADRAATLDELHREILAFDAHPLARSTAAVPGRPGDRCGKSPLMLLGKSPAAQETVAGKPYQGQAAQLLRRAVADAGVDFETLYQSYASAWRPRKENTPNATQIAFSRPFALKEIEIVRPGAVLALGSVALECLFGGHGPMEDEVGTWKEFRTSGGMAIPVLAVYNHAMVMRFPGEYSRFVRQIAEAANRTTPRRLAA